MRVIQTLFCLALALIVAKAMVCFKGICDTLPKQEPLECKGSLIENGGFCGCSDVCAKLEGEECQTPTFLRGLPSLGTCDTGLTCQAVPHMRIGAGKCVRTGDQNQVDDNRTNRRASQTLCQRRRIQAMIVQVVYEGQWFPKCDSEGNFEAEQCDNTGTCFCVDVNTGVVDESSKVQGGANCDAMTGNETVDDKTSTTFTSQWTTSPMPEWG